MYFYMESKPILSSFNWGENYPAWWTGSARPADSQAGQYKFSIRSD